MYEDKGPDTCYNVAYVSGGVAQRENSHAQ